MVTQLRNTLVGIDAEPTGGNVTQRLPVNFLPCLKKMLRCLVEEMERNGKRKQNTSASCNIEVLGASGSTHESFSPNENNSSLKAFTSMVKCPFTRWKCSPEST